MNLPINTVKWWILKCCMLKSTNNSFCECFCGVFKEDVHKLSSHSLSHQPHFRWAKGLRRLRCLMWWDFRNVQAPLEFMCLDVSQVFNRKEWTAFKEIVYHWTCCVLIIAVLLRKVQGEAPEQMKGSSMCIIAETCHVFLTLTDVLPLLNCPIMRD